MLKFKPFLLEYLTDEQRNRFSQYKMSDKARSDTDPFFGSGNDTVHGEIKNDDKSEIHKQLENHLGQTVSHEDYRRGLTADKHGRDVKIGRLIKDNDLRTQFDKDPSRKSVTTNFKTSTVRGTEVAGQTNPVPNEQHPRGHSWGNASCKNVENGINKHYLPHEIKHGTVVHFVHDHNGQEIYRATLHPHHNGNDDVAYAVDAEYGIKHPAFTADAHEVAKKLSGEYKPGLFFKHPNVYDDSGVSSMLHPAMSAKHISKALTDPNHVVRWQAINHPDATEEHLSKALADPHPTVRYKALTHPNMTTKLLDGVMKSGNADDRYQAARHNKTSPEALVKAANDPDMKVRVAALSNGNMPRSHLDKVMADPNSTMHTIAIKNPNIDPKHIDNAIEKLSRDYTNDYDVLENPALTHDHLSKLLNSNYNAVRRAALRHPNITPDHIHMALDHENPTTRYSAISSRKATPRNIDKALDDDSFDVRSEAAAHDNASSANISKAQNHPDPLIRQEALRNINIKPHHLIKALDDSDHWVRYTAAGHGKVTPAVIDHALDSKDDAIAKHAISSTTSSRVATAENLHKALGHTSEDVRWSALRNPNITKEHLVQATHDPSSYIRSEAEDRLKREYK